LSHELDAFLELFEIEATGRRVLLEHGYGAVALRMTDAKWWSLFSHERNLLICALA
jgi:hypothetical protein